VVGEVKLAAVEDDSRGEESRNGRRFGGVPDAGVVAEAMDIANS
jgi:hypothetical protein